ncbi:hypothetical protein BDZ89DRAFT_1048588 [Hymenopellis radicata]|nr:hypothetical protein BDZ89DRAFT_1048588 [Hymenopellis radicata]
MSSVTPIHLQQTILAPPPPPAEWAGLPVVLRFFMRHGMLYINAVRANENLRDFKNRLELAFDSEFPVRLQGRETWDELYARRRARHARVHLGLLWAYRCYSLRKLPSGLYEWFDVLTGPLPPRLYPDHLKELAYERPRPRPLKKSASAPVEQPEARPEVVWVAATPSPPPSPPLSPSLRMGDDAETYDADVSEAESLTYSDNTSSYPSSPEPFPFSPLPASSPIALSSPASSFAALDAAAAKDDDEDVHESAEFNSKVQQFIDLNRKRHREQTPEPSSSKKRRIDSESPGVYRPELGEIL